MQARTEASFGTPTFNFGNHKLPTPIRDGIIAFLTIGAGLAALITLSTLLSDQQPIDPPKARIVERGSR